MMNEEEDGERELWFLNGVIGSDDALLWRETLKYPYFDTVFNSLVSSVMFSFCG